MRNQPIIVKDGTCISISFLLFVFCLLWLDDGCAFRMMKNCGMFQQQRGLFLSPSRKSVGRNGYNVTFLQQECQNDVTLYNELYTEYRWNIMFTLLQQYEIEHGHVHVPYRTKYQSESLGRWITLIRRYKRQNQLSSKWVDKFTHDLQTKFSWDNPPKRYPTKTNKSNTPLTTTTTTTSDVISTKGSTETDSASLELLLPSEPMIFSTTATHTDKHQQKKQEEYNELCLKLFLHHQNTTTNENNLRMTSLCQTFSKSTSAQLTLWRLYTVPNLSSDPKYNFLLTQSPTKTITNNKYDEYIQELDQFFKTYGHSYVPLAYPNSSLGSFLYDLRNNNNTDRDEGNNNTELKQMLQTLYLVDFEIDEISFQQKAFPVMAKLRTNPTNNGDGDGYGHQFDVCKLFEEETNILLQQKQKQ